MLQCAVSENLFKALAPKRQVTPICHNKSGGNTELAGNSICRSDALQRRIYTDHTIASLGCTKTPAPPIATDLKKRSILTGRQSQFWNGVFSQITDQMLIK